MSGNVTIGGGQAPLNFTGAQSSVPAAGTAAFNTYFVNTASSVIYAGYGTIAPATTSPNSSLIITANTATTVPGGYSAVLDSASGDTLTGGGPATSYFLQNNGTGLGTVLNLAAGATSVYALGADTVQTGTADASIYAGEQGATVAGGSGNLYFVGGTGAVSVMGGDGSTTLFGGLGEKDTQLTAGRGHNVLFGGTGTGNTTLVGGTGTTIAYAQGTGPTTLIAGAGNNELVGALGGGNELLATNPNGNSGVSLIDMNNFSDTLLGGSGASTVFGGQGFDVYGFINGHAGGTVAIYGLKDTDTIVFGGYSSNPIAHEQVVNGSDVLTLTDGTVITVEGHDHTIFK